MSEELQNSILLVNTIFFTFMGSWITAMIVCAVHYGNKEAKGRGRK